MDMFDKTGQPEQPSELNYTIHDLESGTEVRGKTSLPVSESVEITLEPSDNTLITDGENEKRIVTVEATYADNQKQTGQYIYGVREIKHIPMQP